ncbi:hypothetical protein BEL04_13025 [Mucilaginibacter sp. PPCGB 2223]|uniref:SMI1/KNR4 family protein n=1 Tax=Mucilaginibacter sp. PPCGB 2223 TaxID=1886027 RepID=UPI000824C3C5|nr:SMI1/KNR4 family protein [Mucilaginibacter sp. PPCGB 2223]OCX52385.1 hypothetical protein BEL04_13025 [Mucilaginibacter sp. PPCGB 2223]
MKNVRWGMAEFMSKFPAPIDSTNFFETIKVACEKKWQKATLDTGVWGYQTQQGTKWKPGLTDIEIKAFEIQLGFTFPPPLKNFYKTMNGTTKPGINIGGVDQGLPPEYQSKFYSLPGDIGLAVEYINWIYEKTGVAKNTMQREGISRIFPVYGHRFMLIDHPANPILSMYGNDIIYWADSIGELLAMDIFNKSKYFDSDRAKEIADMGIKFWLDFH